MHASFVFIKLIHCFQKTSNQNKKQIEEMMQDILKKRKEMMQDILIYSIFYSICASLWNESEKWEERLVDICEGNFFGNYEFLNTDFWCDYIWFIRDIKECLILFFLFFSVLELGVF